jgi:two-component system, chemotaxis family, response regulator Rcp1
MFKPRPAPVILLVEDVDSDAHLVEAAFAELDDQITVFRVGNVDLALKFFLKSAEFSATPRADLVLLDINLPGKNGYDLLETMQSDAGLRGIRVVVLSTAGNPADKPKSLSLGAVGHIGKPWTYTGYEAAAREILQMIRKDSTGPEGKHGTV